MRIYRQLSLPITGSLVVRGHCPICKGDSTQVFNSKKVDYYLCQYCLHKWRKGFSREVNL